MLLKVMAIFGCLQANATKRFIRNEFQVLREKNSMPIVYELYADVFGSHIGKHSERLVYKQGEKTLQQAPLIHLQSVIIGSKGVSISSDAIAECCERGIPIFFLDSLGNHYASLYSAGLGGTILTRRAQLYAYDDGRGAALSLAIADAKINNQAATLKYIAKSRKETDPDCYNMLRTASIEVASQSANLAELQDMTLDNLRAYLMSFEAQAAIHYWKALRAVVPETYGWVARTGRGAVDPVNSLLNYGYGILRKQVESAIVMAGLDPYAGFIHSDRPGKPSLIFDLMEEFRSVAVDRLVIGLVNRKYSVEITEHGRLSDETRKNFAEKMAEHLNATVRYSGARFAIHTVIGRQAHRLAAHLRGETDAYLPYRAEW